MSLFVQNDEDSDSSLELSQLDDENVILKSPKNHTSKESYDVISTNSDNINLNPDIENIHPINIQLSLPLSFQQSIVENMLISDDCFLVLGKGLGMEPIVANLLHILATPTKINGQDKRSLILLLNAYDEVNLKIQEELMELFWTCENNEKRPFIVVNSSSYTMDQRVKFYSSGGIISVTSRILIVDLLSGIINPNNITGLIIFDADSINSFSTESFIVDIYRASNKWGFIKAVTESAELLTTKFNPLQRRLKDLNLKKVLLWPRFHADISSCLNVKKDNKVIEIKVSLTDSMAKIHFGLLECLKKCIDELTRKNSEVAHESWNIDNAFDSDFLSSIHSTLMPIWHRVSYESKQLVKDIGTLKKLLYLLVIYDAVDFYELIQIILDANKPSITRQHSESPWLLVNESQLVISYAKKRVIYNDEYELEELPKWDQLILLLDDIYTEKSSNLDKNTGPILIMCSHDTIITQLEVILSYNNTKYGGKKLMVTKLQSYVQRREMINETTKEIQEGQENEEIQLSRSFFKKEVNSKRRRMRGSAAITAVSKLRNTDTKEGEDIDNLITLDSVNQQHDILLDQIEKNNNQDIEIISTLDEPLNNSPKETSNKNFIKYEYINRTDQIIIEKFHRKTDDLLLQELMPSHIIMYDPNLSFIRRLETYRATYKNLGPKIFFMYYGDSVEEQQHLTAIRKEKEAFTKLIRENANLAQHFEGVEDLSRYKNLVHRKVRKSGIKNTRIAGGQSTLNESQQDVVIVDMREFRAPLPGLLYRYGVDVIPCMLTIGDYIITPKICIERKSIADLIGSFRDGRLTKQCEKMTYYYAYPTLLIEFDDNQSFSLEPFSERRAYNSTTSSTIHPVSNKLMQEEIQAELSKLVMMFPTLKILWSSSPLQTVNIIIDLKTNREQPDPIISSKIGTENRKNKSNLVEPCSEKMFRNLLTIPGFSSIDYYNIKKRVKSYENLQKMDLEDISTILLDHDLSLNVYNFLQRELENYDIENDFTNLG